MSEEEQPMDFYKVTDTGCERKVFASFPTQREAMDWVDDLLLAMKDTSLLSALNDIQRDSNLIVEKDGKRTEYECFPNKYDMPLIIVNLVLKEHGIQITDR